MDVNIIEVIEEQIKFFEIEADQRGIELKYTPKLETKHAFIRTDSEKVIAILVNLIKNALKFTSEGFIEVSVLLKDKMLEFAVIDTGAGIPVTRQKAIFDRFVQADSTDHRAFEGAGLGLSISKAYVEILGGKIWLESEEGVGTRFYFTIPFLPKKVEEESKSKIQIQSGDKPKLNILIVDDNQASSVFLKKVLQSYTNRLYDASRGQQAIDICRSNPDIDLVLMDVKMPEMDGLEATRQIRTFNQDVIIWAQTAHAMAQDHLKSIEAGCNEHISKPISRSDLIKKVIEYFGD